MSAPPVYGQPGPQQGYSPPQNGQQPQQYGPPAQAQQQGYGPPPPVQNAGQPFGNPSQQSEDASGFFDGSSGSPAISFGGKNKGFGEWHGGIFTGVISEKQSKDYDTKKPMFWDSGDPMLDVVVELLSPARDANNPLDDGRRRMFVPKRDTHIEDSMYSVVKEATRNGFHRGGQLWVCKVTTRPGEKSDRNVWQASYIPPTAETLAILDNLPPQGVSQQGAQSVQQNHQAPAPTANVDQYAAYAHGPNGVAPQVGAQQYQQAPAAQQGPFVPPAQNGQPQYQQGPPAQQPQYAPAAQQGYGPPEQGPPGTAWNGQQQGPPQQYQQVQGDPSGQPQYQQGPPPQQGYQQGPPPQQYQQGAPAQTGNPYAQYQQ